MAEGEGKQQVVIVHSIHGVDVHAIHVVDVNNTYKHHMLQTRYIQNSLMGIQCAHRVTVTSESLLAAALLGDGLLIALCV